MKKTLHNDEFCQDNQDSIWNQPFPHLCINTLKKQSVKYWRDAINNENLGTQRGARFDYTRFTNWIPEICCYILDKDSNDLNEFTNDFIDEIKNDTIQISEVSTACTVYWQYTDSYFGEKDVIWARKGIKNYILQVKSSWRIQNCANTALNKLCKSDWIVSKFFTQ